MNDIVKIGLIVGGGYLVSKYVFGFDPLASLVAAPVTTTGPGTPVNTGGGTSTTPQANNPTLANTVSLVAAAMKKAGNDPTQMYTFDTWNYWYQQVRGIPGPDPNQYLSAANRSENISISEWQGYMQQGGFNGLGLLAHRINPYWNPQGTPEGDNLLANGFEKYAVYRN